MQHRHQRRQQGAPPLLLLRVLRRRRAAGATAAPPAGGAGGGGCPARCPALLCRCPVLRAVGRVAPLEEPLSVTTARLAATEQRALSCPAQQRRHGDPGFSQVVGATPLQTDSPAPVPPPGPAEAPPPAPSPPSPAARPGKQPPAQTRPPRAAGGTGCGGGLRQRGAAADKECVNGRQGRRQASARMQRWGGGPPQEQLPHPDCKPWWDRLAVRAHSAVTLLQVLPGFPTPPNPTNLPAVPAAHAARCPLPLPPAHPWAARAAPAAAAEPSPAASGLPPRRQLPCRAPGGVGRVTRQRGEGFRAAG